MVATTFNPGSPPVYWLRVPKPVMDDLRPFGFHSGFGIDSGGIDKNLAIAFSRESMPSARAAALRDWSSWVEREACAMRNGRPTIWHPQSEQYADVIRELFGRRLIEINAATKEDALHDLHLTKWNFGIFYHVACMGNWREVVREQFNRVAAVGLDGLRVSLLGTAAERDEFLRIAGECHVEVSIEFRHDSLSFFEIPAIRLIESWCEANKGKGYVLYFHTKGVSQAHDQAKVDWRRLMMREVIGNWRANAAELRSGTEAIGVNWQSGLPHFQGNFWMARADYVRTLPEFGKFAVERHFRYWQEGRLCCEFWIGDGRPKVKSLISTDENIDAGYFGRHPV